MSLWNSVSSLFTPSAKSVLGIDIGSSSIKITEVKNTGGKLVLQTYGEIALGPFEQKEIGQTTTLSSDQMAVALREILDKTHVTTNQAVLSVPASASLLFIAELPKGSETKLDEIIPNEARKYIPVPLNEVTLDWMLVPDVYVSPDMSAQMAAAPKTRVLVAATRNEALSAYTNILAQAHVTALSYELEVFAQVRSCIGRELSPVAIVDIGAAKTRVAIVHHGVVFTTQTLGRGAHALTESIARTLNLTFDKAEHLKRTEGVTGTHTEVTGICKSFMDQLVTEISAVVTRYEKDYHHAVEKMILVGGGAQLPGLVSLMQSHLTMNIATSNAFNNLERPEILHDVLTGIDSSFAESIGLAMKPFNTQ